MSIRSFTESLAMPTGGVDEAGVDEAGMDKAAWWGQAGKFLSSLARPGIEMAKRPQNVTALGQVGRVASGVLGGTMGSETGHAMAPWASTNLGGTWDPEKQQYQGGVRFNPLGFAGGFMMGHGGLSRTGLGQTLEKPLMRSWYGSSAGQLGDYAASLAGVDTGGRLGQIGGWGGMATGLAGNRYQNARDQIGANFRSATDPKQLISTYGGHAGTARPFVRREALDAAKAQRDALNQSWTGMLERGGKGMEQVWHGGMDPMYGGFRRLGNFFTGSKNVAPMMPIDPLMHAARRIGQVGVLAPAAIGAGGMAYHGLTGQLKTDTHKALAEMYPAIREQVQGDTEDWMQQRGMLNRQGQFDATGGLSGMVSPFLQMLGGGGAAGGGRGQNAMHQAMSLGGPLMAAGGAFTGNPWLTAAGIGSMAYPHFAGQGQGGGQGQLQHQHGQYAPPNAATARNELDVQRREMGAASGQGYL